MPPWTLLLGSHLLPTGPTFNAATAARLPATAAARLLPGCAQLALLLARHLATPPWLGSPPRRPAPSGPRRGLPRASTGLLASGDEFRLPDFLEVVLHRTQIPRYMLATTGADPWTAFFRRVISLCCKTDAILVNTVQELESSGLEMLRTSFGVQPWPIGPIIAMATPSDSHDNDASIIQWLGAHPPRSVLYKSFGSQNNINADQMTELALGLETSGRPFLWVVWPPLGFNAKDGFKPEWLPTGFEERMSQAMTGMLVHGWAPQVRILAHPSTGAFMSHCGRNSILESMCHDVPLIGWPLGAEQFFNARLVVEWGVCVEVARGNLESSLVARAAVAEAVGMVIGDTEKGEEMKRNAGVGGAALVVGGDLGGVPHMH